MKVQWHRIVALAALLVSMAFSGAARADVPWSTNFEAARRAAVTYKKPMLLDFYADWCGWCKRLDADVYSQPAIQQEMRNFIPVKLNVEGNGARQAAYFRVEGLPTIIVLSPEGQILKTIPGYVEPAAMLSVLRSVRVGTEPARPAEATTRPAQTAPSAPVVRPGSEVVKAETVKNETLPQWSVIKSGPGQPSPSGVYILDENGATRIDTPAPQKPAAKKPKTSKPAAKKQKKS